MSDARDTNHDGKVSLMEKVKDKLHGHKNADTTTGTGYSTSTHNTTSSTHHHNGTAAAVPIIGQQPVIGMMPVAGVAAPMTAAPMTTGMPMTTGSSMPMTTGSSMPLADSRDLNRDGHVSMSEKLASTHIGGQSEEAHLRLHEEQLAISKREVGAGEVDIHKRVIEQHVQQTIPVRREEVIVERRPLSGVADANARIAPQDETMRVALFREEIVTEKRIVPTEEVIVRKKEVIDQQTVGATLRSEHVETVQTGTHSSAVMGAGVMGAGLHDARDTNYDGHVSMGEKLKGGSAMGTNSTGLHDARDTNYDGHVSMGEKLQGGSAMGAKGLDTNHDGHVSAGEKLRGAARG